MTDDGNEWVDGYCWPYCGRQWTRVLWIGPANVAGAQAPMYACGPCICELQDRVWQAILLEDRPAPPSRCCRGDRRQRAAVRNTDDAGDDSGS